MLGESKPTDAMNSMMKPQVEAQVVDANKKIEKKNGQKSRGKLSSEKNISKYHIVTLISLCNVQKVFQK